MKTLALCLFVAGFAFATPPPPPVTIGLEWKSPDHLAVAIKSNYAPQGGIWVDVVSQENHRTVFEAPLTLPVDVEVPVHVPVTLQQDEETFYIRILTEAGDTKSVMVASDITLAKTADGGVRVVPREEMYARIQSRQDAERARARERRRQ